MKVEPRKGKFTGSRVTPADRIMAELPDVYYRLSEVSKMVGVSEKTLRRQINSPDTTAPSAQVTHGGMQMYLYTPQDVEELRRYYRKEPHAHNPQGGVSPSRAGGG